MVDRKFTIEIDANELGFILHGYERRRARLEDNRRSERKMVGKKVFDVDLDDLKKRYYELDRRFDVECEINNKARQDSGRFEGGA